MQIHLVRHACAGRKRDWDGPDAERPLDTVGVAQAVALDRFFAEHPPTRLLSSPSRRCTETVEPLARRLGIPVERTDQLGTDADPGELLRFMATAVDDGAALCTHGEVMSGLLAWVPLDGEPDRERLLTKGGVWTLTLVRSPCPRIARFELRLPSSLRTCTVHERGPAGPAAAG
jgi:phosphohistidine phosphatase SixA